ncbi:MAG: DegV family protein [Faecousia sp.]
MKIKITSDSTCDLSPELLRENNISIIPLHINKNGESFRDGLDIVPADIFAHVAAGGEICSTSAVSLGEYEEAFKKNLEGYDALVHISIGSGFSVTHHNACIVAENMPNVRVIDSRNLSTGQGQVVLEACRLAKTATDLDEMKAALDEFAGRVDMSFLLDRLDYMVKGGRCSLVSALGANILKLKPCIEVVDNKMIVGKKYRGNYAKCMERYVLDRLENQEDILPERIFIVNTPVSQEVHETVRRTVRECMSFETTYETTAGCTISCHCGEGTLGICYVHKKA